MLGHKLHSSSADTHIFGFAMTVWPNSVYSLDYQISATVLKPKKASYLGSVKSVAINPMMGEQANDRSYSYQDSLPLVALVDSARS
jgi:hypothetical protein